MQAYQKEVGRGKGEGKGGKGGKETRWGQIIVGQRQQDGKSEKGLCALITFGIISLVK